MEHHDATGVSPRDKRCEKLVRTGINGCSAMARPLTHLTHGICTRRPFHPGKTRRDSETKGGTLQLADSRTFKVSTTIAAALQTIRPGAMRQMHWHPNADEWQYYIKGKARMGVFNTGPNVVTMDFNPGDIGYVPRDYGPYVQNVGVTDMQFFPVFRPSR